jgi:serine/threonine protein kinase
VVHRDLKSRNILLTQSLDAKLIDFGISCERQDVTMTAGVGTSLWMAPEVMQGKRYNEKADVFSFGVILSELDTHELRYDHAVDTESKRKMTDIVMMNLICAGKLKPRFTEMAHPEMVSLATDCLEVDPSKRPFASEVLYRIHRCLKNDRTLTTETRLVITRSLNTAETSTRTRSRGKALKRLPEST